MGNHKSLARVTKLCLLDIQELVAQPMCNEINDDVFMTSKTLSRTPFIVLFCNLKENSIQSHRQTYT
jgi:hypothetical protein